MHSHRWKIIVLKKTIHYHKVCFRRKIIILKRPYVLLNPVSNLYIYIYIYICLLFISSLILSANPGRANVNLRHISNTISWWIVMCDTLKHDTADLFLLLITVVLLHFLWFQCSTGGSYLLSQKKKKKKNVVQGGEENKKGGMPHCHYLPYCPA